MRDGCELLVLSDRTAYEGDRRYLDPHLALAAVDLALREHWVEPGETNLRRRCGVVLRSAALRNVHDVMVALGPGRRRRLPVHDGRGRPDGRLRAGHLATSARRCARASRRSSRRSASTRCAATRACSARSGSGPELTAIFDTPAYFGASDKGGTGFAELDADGDERQRVLAGEEESKPAKTFRFYPKVYKAAVAAANGAGSVRGVLGEGARARARAADLAAAHPRPEVRPRAGARGERRGGPARLPDRDLVDELRLAGRGGLPRLRRGRQADQHHRHERRGRRDPGHVRQVPALARPAGGLGPLRRDQRDDQLVLPRRDQDRPGREARRGRPPAGQEGHREGRPGA